MHREVNPMVAVYEYDVVVHTQQAEPLTLVDELAMRLERGLDMIEARKANGQSIERHEEHWITLLKDYELAFDNQT
jgi:hypothetical protein